MFADILANTYIRGVRGNKKFPLAKMSLVKQDEGTGGGEKETRERFSLCGEKIFSARKINVVVLLLCRGTAAF